MPTAIYFAGQSVRVTVEEEPGEVAEAFTSAGVVPVRLTRQGGQGSVYVNPSTVAFWAEPEPAPEPPPQEPERRAIDRNTVTDIWGQPLQRKPRR